MVTLSTFIHIHLSRKRRTVSFSTQQGHDEDNVKTLSVLKTTNPVLGHVLHSF